MVREIKTFEWHCDCCKTTRLTHGLWQNDSRPDGWETFRWEPSFSAGYTHDFCLECIREAKENHTMDEDNYYGMILRKKEVIRKYRIEQEMRRNGLPEEIL
jgi:hypothetical protein